MLARLRQKLAALRQRAAGRETIHPAPRDGAVVHELLDPTFLRTQLERLHRESAGLLPEARYEEMHAELVAAEQSHRSGADPTQGRQAFLPRSAALSALQSTLTDCVLSRADDLVAPLPPGHRSFAEYELREEDVFRRFGPCDTRWVEAVIAKGIAHFEKRPPFVDGKAPDVAVADDARVVVVGDWGTGLPGARAVAEQMAKAIEDARSHGREVHAVHLGDVYYSGWKEEYRSRFMPYWPVRSAEERVGSWALNGNHDMYSGGHGYFDYLLRDPRFSRQQGSSYFCLQTSSWQLLGLDSAYRDADLAGNQASWVAAKLGDGGRKTMLLTHHQPFSSFVEVNPPLVGTLAGAGVRHVDAWLWGHEHLCCAYERDHHPIVSFGSCIGHGGVPVLARSGPPPPGVSWHFHEASVQHGNDRWQAFGFAVLDFDGPRIEIRYFDQRGALNHLEHLD